MIRVKDSLYILETDNTSYIMNVTKTGQCEHLYYGPKIPVTDKMLTDDFVRSMTEKKSQVPGNCISYSKEEQTVCLEDICLEYSSYGKGDIREPMVELSFADGSTTCDFVFANAQVTEGKICHSDVLPSSYSEDKAGVSTLVITYKEKAHNVLLNLSYSVFEKCDAIVRSSQIVCNERQGLNVKRLLSTQFDFDRKDIVFTNFTGHWAREMNKQSHVISSGKFVNATMAGISSNRANPFVMLSEETTSEEYGPCMGINLIYSGNHYSALEVSGQEKSRFVQGINPTSFCFSLGMGESFESPESVCIYSDEGFGKMSRQMHEFVREHIVRGTWKKKERPVLINSWEASYFKFNESSLLKLAREAKDVGIELFVMDDGWFGKRNDDTTSLGDWYVNKSKLPGGIEGLSKKINDLGLLFGLWVEPEMISEDSDLYRAHPEYAVKIPGRDNSPGRNQMILDLANPDVCDCVIKMMKDVFSQGNISYVKWDMNRLFADAYSVSLPAKKQGEFYHRYILGLYRIMKSLTEQFPDILFEGCASGGCRFDLGILSYFPQIWASDNTDASCRNKIQEGYSYGYPTSVLGAHVSACPNHQTLRNTPLDTRFNVASFGILGYELNLCDLKSEELSAIKEQIASYKSWRSVYQYGTMYRMGEGKRCMVSPSGDRAVVLLYQDLARANSVYEKIACRGLCDDKMYHFSNDFMKHSIAQFGDLINMFSPIHIKQDSLLHHAVAKVVKMDGETEDYILPGAVLGRSGVKLSQAYGGTGYDSNTRLFQDFSSRLYYISEINCE